MIQIDHRNVFAFFLLAIIRFSVCYILLNQKKRTECHIAFSPFFDIIRLLSNNCILILFLLQLLKIFHSLCFEEFVDATQVFFYSLVSELVNLGN